MDEELCRQLQAGNEAAMEALVHRHHRAVYAFLYRLTGDAHTAEDLAQEAFIRLCTKVGSYRCPEPFLPWLYTIAHNIYRDWRKNAYQRKVVPVEQPEEPAAPLDLMERLTERAEVVRVPVESVRGSVHVCKGSRSKSCVVGQRDPYLPHFRARQAAPSTLRPAVYENEGLALHTRTEHGPGRPGSGREQLLLAPTGADHLAMSFPVRGSAQECKVSPRFSVHG